MTSPPPASGPGTRTPEHPMDFSRDELTNGALWTWALFNAIIPLGVLASMLWSLPTSSGWSWSTTGLQIVGFVIIVCGVVALTSLVLMPFGLLAAWPIARLLRRVRAVPLHVSVYTLLGAGIGLLYLAVTGSLGALGALGEVNSYTILLATPAVAITIATPLGWWLTARRALRKDAGLIRTRAAVDAVAGDAATEDAAAEDAATS